MRFQILPVLITICLLFHLANVSNADYEYDQCRNRSSGKYLSRTGICWFKGSGKGTEATHCESPGTGGSIAYPSDYGWKRKAAPRIT